jgi:predicted nucleic acid-binding protein
MPAGSSDTADVLVDTSVAVALSVADHEHHEMTSSALERRRLGLAGHAAFETFSVLTRLPIPARRSPAVVARLLAANFPGTRFLDDRSATTLLADLGRLAVGGGAVYDALVGACAKAHGLPLATRDRRALETYRVLGVELEFLG